MHRQRVQYKWIEIVRCWSQRAYKQPNRLAESCLYFRVMNIGLIIIPLFFSDQVEAGAISFWRRGATQITFAPRIYLTRMLFFHSPGGASHRLFHNDADQHMSAVFVIVVSMTGSLTVLGLVAVVWVVLRHRRRQRNGVTSTRRTKCPALSPLADARVSAGDSMQRACTAPLITSFRLPPLPVASPSGHETNYENEHSYEHHYDVLEYRAPADVLDYVAGQHRGIVGDKATSLEQVYARRSGGYSPWPPHHLTRLPTSNRACSGLVYHDRR